MATTFPTTLDNLTNPLPTDRTNSPSHAGLHTNANDAIEATQAYVGVASATGTGTLTGRIKALEAGGGGGPSGPVAWTDITGKPTEFPPSAHNQAISTITGLQPALDGKLGATAPALSVDDLNSAGVVKQWIGTQAQYNALGNYAADTFYSITDADPIGGGGGGGSTDWADITNKPATFPPAAHTHAIADTTGLQTALDGKAASSHTHTIANVTGLQTALDSKAASSHSHAIADVTGLQTALDGKLGATAAALLVNDNGAGVSLKFWFGTEAQYNAIVTKDSSTVYLRSA